jgi:hypothetical protein
MLVASAAAAQGGDLASLSAELGGEPLYCAHVAGDAQLCTWHVRRREHVVCELAADGQRTAAPCLRRPDNESMLTFPSGSGPGPTVWSRPSRSRLRHAARTELADARTLDDMVRLVGAGPVWCEQGEQLACGWYVRRRTPGYITVARAADAPGRKVGLVCRFAPDGSPAACTAAASPRAPAPQQ